MQIIEFINKSIALLTPLYPEREARAIALRLLQEVAGLSNYAHLVEPQTLVPEKVGQQLQECVHELTTGRPVQYVLGYEWFMEHQFRVCEGVLIPRPETEELVRLILKQYAAVQTEPLAILDICTGSGCIAYSLALGFGERGLAYGCDISDQALEVASRQKVSLVAKTDDFPLAKPLFFHCDVLQDNATSMITAYTSGKLDIIVSNPPYVCDSERMQMHKNVLDFEPGIALFVSDEDPLVFYHRIARIAKSLLKNEGKLYFEINEKFGEQVVNILINTGFSRCQIFQDIHGKDRFVQGELLDF